MDKPASTLIRVDVMCEVDECILDGAYLCCLHSLVHENTPIPSDIQRAL